MHGDLWETRSPPVEEASTKIPRTSVPDPGARLRQNLGPRLPCETARAIITPRRVMPAAWRLDTLTARINRQIVQARYPGEMTQCAVTEKLGGSPPISR